VPSSPLSLLPPSPPRPSRCALYSHIMYRLLPTNSELFLQEFGSCLWHVCGGVRPIAVGDTLRRLLAKWLLASAQGRKAAAALAPIQTAFAKGIHCEVVAIGVQAQVDALHGSTGWLLLQVDLKTPFNSIARPGILGDLERLFPSMMPGVRQSFQPAPLLVGPEVIWSTRGVQQGDPLNPVFFAAGIQAALDACPKWGALQR